jgi:hypothetical protein
MRYSWRVPRGGVAVKLAAVFLIFAATGVGAGAQQARDAVVKIVTQIQRADYEGDRAALQRLYGELTPFVDDKELASRVRYWRGFALWRRAINGSNEGVDPKELEEDMTAAVVEFKASAAADPAFVDAKIGAIGCLGYIMYFDQKNPARLQELFAEATPLSKDAKAADANNPRLLWVLMPNIWNTPAERGGGQDAAIASGLKGLEEARKRRGTVTDALDPSWGEPELLMNLAWDNLHRTAPDFDAAEKYANSALAMVPYWHYVRDILIPQIRDAKAAKTKGM